MDDIPSVWSGHQTLQLARQIQVIDLKKSKWFDAKKLKV